MSLERFFVFLYPEDPRLQELLDLALYVLNPREKWPAHVTLAGPYANKRKLPHNLLINSTVHALGVGRFQSDHQNTIYLRVGAESIKEFWDKPDFSGSVIPHLTIYDGRDRALADLLYDSLDKLRLFFFFQVKKIHIVSAVQGQYRSDLLSRVNPKILNETSKMSFREIFDLSPEDRVRISVAALNRAKYYLNLEDDAQAVALN